MRILDWLPGNFLVSCRCVCKCWKEATDIILSKTIRSSCDAAAFVGGFESLNLVTAGISRFLECNPLYLDTIVFLTQTSKYAQGDKKLCHRLQETFNNVFRKDCAPRMVGSVVNFPFGSKLNSLKDLVDTLELSPAIPNTTSVLLFPKLKSYHIDTFHIPMKRKYEMIKGYGNFLPTSHSRTSLVLVFIHPVTLGRMSQFVKAVRKRYGKETCITGLYSETYLFDKHVLTSNEMMGMVLSGNIECISTVIYDWMDIQRMTMQVNKVNQRLEEIPNLTKYIKLVFIFACTSFGNDRTLKLLGQLRRNHKDALIFGAYSPSVFGADFNTHDSLSLPGGRDFLHTKGIVLNFLLIKRDHG